MAQVELRKGQTKYWLVIKDDEGGRKVYRVNPEGSPAWEAGSEERISVDAAYRDHGRTYAAYVWAVHAAFGPNTPVYHAWTGVINAMGHTGHHRPPWNPRTKIFKGGVTIDDLPVVATTDL